MQEFIRKVTSRKFLVAVAAFLVSVGTGISGLVVGNYDLAIAGGIMVVVGTGIYQACEAYVDGQSAKSSVSTTTTTIAASSTSAEIVKKALSGTDKTTE